MAGKNHPYHFKIVEAGQTYMILDDKNDQPQSFSTVPDLLEHFKRINFDAVGGLPVRLTRVLPFSAYRR